MTEIAGLHELRTERVHGICAACGTGFEQYRYLTNPSIWVNIQRKKHNLEARDT
jgi:hypothetical protein